MSNWSLPIHHLIHLRMTTQYLTTLRSYLLKTVNLIHPRWSLLAVSVWWVCQQLEAITQKVGSTRLF